MFCFSATDFQLVSDKLRVLILTGLFLITASAIEATSTGFPWELEPPLDGRELFTPAPLLQDSAYIITITGLVKALPGEMDALYLRDWRGNFREPTDYLRINRRPAREALVSEDRATHTYVFRLVGRGDRATFELRMHADYRPTGGFKVRIERPPVAGKRGGGLLATGIEFSWGPALLALAVVSLIGALLARGTSPSSAPVPVVQAAKSVAIQPAAIVLPEGVSPLLPNGREVFTTFVLGTDRQYHLVVQGSFTDSVGHVAQKNHRQADALYETDKFGNFLVPHDGFQIDNMPARKWGFPCEEDRARHRYVFLLPGSGSRLSVALRPPSGFGLDRQDALFLSVDPVGPAPTPPSQEEIHEDAARELELDTVVLRNWQDSEFRSGYARKYRSTLLDKRESIASQYQAFQRKNPDFVLHLKAYHPELWARVSGALEAMLEAERLDVIEPSRRKETTDEFRHRKVERIRIGVEDTKATLTAVLQAKEEFLALIEEGAVDEEEREQLIATINERLGTLLEGANNGGGGNGPTKSL